MSKPHGYLAPSGMSRYDPLLPIITTLAKYASYTGAIMADIAVIMAHLATFMAQ